MSSMSLFTWSPMKIISRNILLCDLPTICELKKKFATVIPIFNKEPEFACKIFQRMAADYPICTH